MRVNESFKQIQMNIFSFTQLRHSLTHPLTHTRSATSHTHDQPHHTHKHIISLIHSPMSVPFQHDVLRRMESLVSHVINELVQVEREYKIIQSDPPHTHQRQQRSSAKCKNEVKKESPTVKGEPAVKREGVTTESVGSVRKSSDS